MLIIDTHTHIHPSFDTKAAIAAALKNMRLEADCVPVLCLTERYEECLFSTLSQTKNSQAKNPEQLTCTPTKSPEVLKVSEQAASIYLLAGHQLITSEKLEILALGTISRPQDGLSAQATIQSISAAGALAVIPWSPGKWLGQRGQVVKALLAGPQPKDFLVGDIPIRPCGNIFSTPLLSYARKCGCKIVYGSDPLPFKSEETALGTLATEISNVTIDPDNPKASILAALTNSTGRPRGRYNNPIRALLRQIRTLI